MTPRFSKRQRGAALLGRWQPEAMERSPPAPPEAWPANARFALTYHPVHDIA